MLFEVGEKEKGAKKQANKNIEGQSALVLGMKHKFSSSFLSANVKRQLPVSIR